MIKENIKACVKFMPIKPPLISVMYYAVPAYSYKYEWLKLWMKRKRNDRKAEVMTEEEMIKRGREGK